MTPPASSDLCAEGLGITVPGRTLVDDLSVKLDSGRFVAILGRNGAGKTLTLHTLAGLRAPASGSVSLAGRPLDRWPRRDIARRMALLPQATEDVFPTTVVETALAGRHPHLPALARESRRDFDIVHDCLARLGLAGFEDRNVDTLSGGERRRLAIAQVLVQSPGIYLLDEPTNHLDPQHQLDVLNLFRALAHDGRTVVASLHDVNLAARYASHCLLLFGDGRYRFGPADELLDAATLGDLYDTRLEALPWHGGRVFVTTGRDAGAS